MGFPYEVYENFENGAADAFNGTSSDAGNRLDFPHQRQLTPLMPWRGAYCMRLNLGKNNTTAYVERTVSWASGINRYGRFKLFIGDDVQFGNDMDYVRLLQFYSSGPTKEARLTLGRIEPFGLVLASEMEGETWGARGSYFKVPTGKWFTVELKREVSVLSRCASADRAAARGGRRGSGSNGAGLAGQAFSLHGSRGRSRWNSASSPTNPSKIYLLF